VPTPRAGAFKLVIMAADTDGVNFGSATRPVAVR